MTGDGTVVDARHKYPQAVLKATADHEAEVVLRAEVKRNLQGAERFHKQHLRSAGRGNCKSLWVNAVRLDEAL